MSKEQIRAKLVELKERMERIIYFPVRAGNCEFETLFVEYSRLKAKLKELENESSRPIIHSGDC